MFFCSEKLLGLTPVQGGPRYVLVVVAGSIAASMLLIRLQAQVDSYRIAKRGFASMNGPVSP